METKIIGVLMLLGVFVYMWFVEPQKDQYGRYSVDAFATAIALISVFWAGILTILFA